MWTIGRHLHEMLDLFSFIVIWLIAFLILGVVAEKILRRFL